MKDPYRYFRIEARELLENISRGLFELERTGQPSPEGMQALFRWAHTLKGASRAVKRPDIADKAHALEDALARMKAEGGVEPLFVILRDLEVLVRALDEAPVEPQGEAPPAAVTSAVDVVRVDAADLDRLMREVGELRARVESLRQLSARCEDLGRGARAVVRGLRAAEGARSLREVEVLADQQRRDVGALAAAADGATDAILAQLDRLSGTGLALRLVRVEEIFGLLERAVRETAQVAGKRVNFVTSGGDQKLDAGSLARLRDGLLHVVRNAVVHGVEGAEERARRGKPEVGTVRFWAERRGAHIALICEDDGGGLDPDALFDAAREAGAIGAGEQDWSKRDRERLALVAGVSTAPSLTQEAGRGVGLDVLRATVAELRGQIDIASTPGRGARFSITVPTSLHAVSALLCEAGGEVAALPLDAVERVYPHPGADEEVLEHEGRAVPVMPLRSLVGDAQSEAPLRTAIVVRVDGAFAALGVERLIGSTQLVMRPMPRSAGPLPFVGAAFDAEGTPRPVIDPAALMRGAGAGAAKKKRAAPRRRPVLVVDDSLTTRMLEQSILESAGYEVDLASSAEEALEKVAARPYALLLVDVEMPGMSGVEFVARTREDPRTRETPAVIVSSRGAPEDIRKGVEAGARAYVVKGEFDQRKFLETVRRLID